MAARLNGYPFLNPDDFNRLIAHGGQNVLWRRAYACPCRDVYSGAADPACPRCRGRGNTWADPESGHVALSGMARNKMWADMGNWEAGDVVVTLPGDSPVYDIGDNDRMTFVDSSEAFSIIYRRGEDDVDLIHRLAQIDRAHWLAEGVEVNGTLPSLSSGALVWPTAGTVPAAGTQYTLTGRRCPEYFVWGDLVQVRHHHAGLRLPRRVVLRRFDLFGR